MIGFQHITNNAERTTRHTFCFIAPSGWAGGYAIVSSWWYKYRLAKGEQDHEQDVFGCDICGSHLIGGRGIRAGRIDNTGDGQHARSG
jgi:hypothetical protein